MGEAELKIAPVSTEALIDALYASRACLDELNTRKAEELDALITPAIRFQMQIIEAKYALTIPGQVEVVAMREAAVRDRVLAEGCSTKGQRLHAIWVKGRVSWDSKGLDAFSIAEPRILAFRSEGSPTVTIRGIKE